MLKILLTDTCLFGKLVGLVAGFYTQALVTWKLEAVRDWLIVVLKTKNRMICFWGCTSHPWVSLLIRQLSNVEVCSGLSKFLLSPGLCYGLVLWSHSWSYNTHKLNGPYSWLLSWVIICSALGLVKNPRVHVVSFSNSLSQVNFIPCLAITLWSWCIAIVWNLSPLKSCLHGASLCYQIH